MLRGRRIIGLFAGLGLLALAGCETAPSDPGAGTGAPPGALSALPGNSPPEPYSSPRSRAVARHYARVQNRLLAQGLLRTGGGGIDTPYTDTDLLRNFERIAFYDEYARGSGLQASDGNPVGLRKWAGPVRMTVEFGASVPQEQRRTDQEMVARYAARLSRITGLPISMTADRANFTVLIMGEDDRQQAVGRVRALVPNINTAAISLLNDLPRSIHCLVMAFSGEEESFTYKRAIAFIRAEHPRLLRLSCIHEELAQGLGLANDSPRARPSIFNDDNEFALLTTHDEELLRLLYNPALRPGMTPDEARPILRQLIRARRGGPS